MGNIASIEIPCLPASDPGSASDPADWAGKGILPRLWGRIGPIEPLSLNALSPELNLSAIQGVGYVITANQEGRLIAIKVGEPSGGRDQHGHAERRGRRRLKVSRRTARPPIGNCASGTTTAGAPGRGSARRGSSRRRRCSPRTVGRRTRERGPPLFECLAPWLTARTPCLLGFGGGEIKGSPSDPLYDGSNLTARGSSSL